MTCIVSRSALVRQCIDHKDMHGMNCTKRRELNWPAHSYRRGQQRHTGPLEGMFPEFGTCTEDRQTDRKTDRQLLTLCSLYCSPCSERCLRKTEARIPTLEMRHSVQTRKNKKVHNDLSLKRITRSHVLGCVILYCWM
jgi:hypothetical protein